MKEAKNKKINFVIGGIFLLMLVIGGTYAYFQILSTNNATSTTISGTGELVGQATLSTNIEELKLNLTAEIMSKDNIGKSYYATETGDAVENPTLGTGRYTLATASLTESDVALDCTYSYDISASVTKAIEDASDEDLKVVITEASGIKTTYTLKSLLNGITHTGKIKKLEHGIDKTLKVEAYIENTSDKQNNLSGNEYTITITPKSGEEGFSCDLFKKYNYNSIYVLDGTTDIENSPKIFYNDFPINYFVKVSDDSEIYKSDLIGSIMLYGNDSDISKLQQLTLDDNVIAYEDNYLTVIGEMTNSSEFAFFVIVHNMPPNIYSSKLLESFVGAEPGVYVASCGFEILSLGMQYANFEGVYTLSSQTDITNMEKFSISSNEQLVKVSDDLPLQSLFGSEITITKTDGKTENFLIDETMILESESDALIFGNQESGEIFGIIAIFPPVSEGIHRGLYLMYNPELIKNIKLHVKAKETVILNSTDDITDKTKLNVDESGIQTVKVSNATPILDELENGTIKLNTIDGIQNISISEDVVDSRSNNDILILADGAVVVVYKSTTIEGVTFTEPGIYLAYFPNYINSVYLAY